MPRVGGVFIEKHKVSGAWVGAFRHEALGVVHAPGATDVRDFTFRPPPEFFQACEKGLAVEVDFEEEVTVLDGAGGVLFRAGGLPPVAETFNWKRIFEEHKSPGLCHITFDVNVIHMFRNIPPVTLSFGEDASRPVVVTSHSLPEFKGLVMGISYVV